VYAALEAPLDPAPDALLDRIISSRAAGGRAVLPIERPRSALLRRRLVRGAIAAGLGLVALASWSRWLRPETDSPDTTSAVALGSSRATISGLPRQQLRKVAFPRSSNR